MSYKNGIINHLIKNEIVISFPDNDEADITEENIVSESMTLKQSICDDEALRFGGCISSAFKIKLLNTVQRQFSSELTGKWISVKITQYYADPDRIVYPSEVLFPSSEIYPGIAVDTKLFYVFSGFIESAVIDKTDKNIINIVAYDVLAKLYKTDATNMLYALINTSAGTPLEYVFNKIRTDFPELSTTGTAAFFNETYTVDNVDLRVGSFDVKNDYWLARKDTVNYGILLKHICEILGVFGIIVPDSGKGTFTFNRLSGESEQYDFYEKLEAEDHQSTGYTDFQFCVSGNDRTGKSVVGGGLDDMADGAIDKIYDFSDNILIMQPYTQDGTGRASTAFDYLINRSSIGARIAMNAETEKARKCALSSYRPLNAIVDGRLWVPVGNPIEILVNQTTVDGSYIIIDGEIQKESIKTYILSRTLTGIQALADNINVKGVR